MAKLRGILAFYAQDHTQITFKYNELLLNFNYLPATAKYLTEKTAECQLKQHFIVGEILPTEIGAIKVLITGVYLPTKFEAKNPTKYNHSINVMLIGKLQEFEQLNNGFNLQIQDENNQIFTVFLQTKYTQNYGNVLTLFQQQKQDVRLSCGIFLKKETQEMWLRTNKIELNQKQSLKKSKISKNSQKIEKFSEKFLAKKILEESHEIQKPKKFGSYTYMP